MSTEMKCWVCSSSDFKSLTKGEIASSEQLVSSDFKITDSKYGSSLPRYKCKQCNFIQCSTNLNLMEFYKNMSDEDYLNDEGIRSLQSRDIVNRVIQRKSSGAWLDIGCASGILMSEASACEFIVAGIEISADLLSCAKAKGYEVSDQSLGTDFWEHRFFDVISMIDVIEHVNNPSQLIAEAKRHLNKDGIIVISTPNCGSLIARVLGSRWWHIRIAHVGYFNKGTLNKILHINKLQIKDSFSPNWYFKGSYILDRLRQMGIPKFIVLLGKFLQNKEIRINLRDSVCVIATETDIK